MEGRKFAVVAATSAHAVAVAARARQSDVDELWASNKLTPSAALDYGLRVSPALTLLMDDEPVCIFGITPLSAITGLGAPWMVGTDKLDTCARWFIRHCKNDLGAFFSEWSRLVNLVDARNTKAIRWLRWLGFSVLPAVSYGPFNLPFHPFIMEVGHV